MSIYTITLKRERLLGNEDDDDGGERDQSRGREAERLTSQLGGGGQSVSEAREGTRIGKDHSQQQQQQRPSGETSSNKSDTFGLNEANWLDCSCGNWTPPGDVDDNKENSLVSGQQQQQQQRQARHSSECLSRRREQLKRLEAKAREIVHSVNVTLEVTADLKEPNPRIVWYRNEKELTSSERPVLYVASVDENSNKQQTSSTKRSIKRTKSQSKRLRSGQGYSIEETTTEIEEEQQVIDNDEKQDTNLATTTTTTGGGLIEKCRQVSSESGSKLTIFNLQDQDYGQYTCRLIDSIGNPVLNIETQLREDQTIKQRNSNKLKQQLHLHKLLGMDEVIEVKEGDLNIELGIQILPETNEDEELMSAEEKAEFIENTTINWFKDDVKLDQNDAEVQRLFQFTYDQNEGFHRLIVRKATKETEGVYTCLVENESGTSSCSTQLVVGPGNKPKLTSRLQDVTVYVGQSLEFRIKSTGLPPIDSCQWFKDDELLIELASSFASDTSIKSTRNERISMSRSEEVSTSSETGERETMLIFRLCIDQLKLDDTGRYKCRINNEFGYDESDCFVKVLQEIIEEHEEVEETIEETMRLGGGKKSTEEETTTTTTVEEEEERRQEEREVKRARQDDGDIEMGEGGGLAPRFRRRLEDRTIIEEEQTTTTTIVEELIVSTEKDEHSSRSNDSFKLRWFVDGQEIPRAGHTDDNQISYRYENFYEETSDENLHKLIVTKTSRSTTRRRSSLLTSSSTKSSQKSIKCQASNQFGQSETSSRLSFVKRPKFLRKLEDTETSVGETIVLKVTVEEETLDDLKFLRDGKLIYSSKTDGNERDITTSSKSRIRIRNYEEIIEVEEEEETTTTTRRSSYASRRLSGALKQKKRGRTYEVTIDNVQIDQQGTWECQASNEAGETSCRADVEVFAEPRIVTDLPEAVRIPPGKEIRLHVEASGSPIPVYSWFKDDVGIAEEEDRVFTETKTTRTTSTTSTTKSRRSSVTSLRNEDGINISGETLIIRGARPEDAGIYSCKIENRLGQVQSRDCKLTIIGHGDDVKGAPKIIKDFSLDQVFQVDEGESLSLKVLAEGQPRPSQHWIKNTTEEIVEETNRVEIEQTGQEYKLKIKKSRQTDSGTYKVVLRNEHGETESRTVEVRVNRSTEETERRPSAPKITLDSQDKVVGLGSNVSFDVEVAGHPKPLITWYKNGRRLAETSDGRVSFVEEETITTTTVIETEEDSTDEGRKTERKETTTIHKLIIKDVKESDEAIYSLKAENDLGSTKSSLVSLNVDKRKQATDEVTTTKTREQQAKSEQMMEEETTTTTTTTVTKTREEQQAEDELEEIERRKSGSKTRRVEETEEDDEGELDEDGKKRKTTRTTRTTTTKTTTTTSEEQEEEEDEETRRRRKLIEKEEEEARRKSKRRTVEEVEEEIEEEEEERTKRRARTDTTTDREDVEEDEETKRKVVSMDVDEEIEEEEEEEIRKKKSKSSKDKTKTSKRRDELEEDELMEEEETIERKDEKKSTRVKPRIVSAPKEVVAGLGSSPELEVIVEEETTTEETVVEETKVTWLKDNQPIPDRLLRDRHIEIIEEVGSQPNTKRRTLRINSLRSSDAGQYKLRVENPQGKAETSPIQVSVDRTMRPGQRPSVTAADIVPPSEQRGPEVVSVPEEVVAGIGSSPKIEAEISGKPEPEVTWFKDGQPITPEQLRDGHLEVVDLPTETPDTVKQALQINDLKPADAAAYHVKAENPAGEVESEPTNVRIDRSMGPTDEPVVTGLEKPEQQPATSDIKPVPSGDSGPVAPAIVSLPKEIVAGQGGRPQIEAEVAGKPEPQLTWLKDGQPISDRDLRMGHVEIVDLPSDKPDTIKQALKINDLRPADVADYQVRADNPSGTVESEPVKVKLDRRMSAQDKPVVKDEPTVVPVTGDETAPKVISMPKEVVAGLGSSPQLEAEVEGVPKPELVWLKDGLPIRDRLLSAGHIEIVDLPTDKPNTIKQALKINDLRPTDVADYQVRAENPSGAVESEPTKLKLDRRMSSFEKPKVELGDLQPAEGQKAPVIVSIPDEIVAGRGSSPQIEAEVEGSPAPQLTWLKDGQPISDRDLRTGHVELVDLPTDQPDSVKQALKINDLRPTDVAAYSVRAENPAGQVESNPAQVKLDRSMSSTDEPVVSGLDKKPSERAGDLAGSALTTDDQVAPSIVSVPEEVVAGRGSSPVFEAEVSGVPKPEITWFKDGQPITEQELKTGHVEIVDVPTDRPDTVKQALKINDMKPADAAAYHVKAENPAGEVESEPTNVRYDRSMGPSDEPVVTGVEKPDQQAPATELRRSPSSESAPVAPTIVSIPKEIVAGQGARPQIEAEVAGKPEPQLTWLKDGQPISDRDLRMGHVEIVDLPSDKPDTIKQALKINDLRPTDTAEYQVRAENPAGSVESEPTKVKLDRRMSIQEKPVVKDVPDEIPADEGPRSAPKIVSMPREVVAGPGSSPQLEAEVQGTPKPELTWLKDGLPIRDRLLSAGHIEIIDLPTDKPDTVKQALKINELRSTDAAAYTLKAENPLGQVESEPANVRVDRSMGPRDEPRFEDVVEKQPVDEPASLAAARQIPEDDQVAPSVVSMPDEVVAGPGSSPQILAEVTGRPLPQVSWFKDGQLLTDKDLRDGHLEVVNLPTNMPDTVKQALRINNLKPADVAAYHIKAENPLGDSESQPTNLRIDRSMRPEDKPQVSEALVDEDSVVPMETDDVVQREAPREDTEKRSSLGQASECAPKIVSSPKEVIAAPGSSPRLEVEVEAQPKAKATWLKDGQPIPARLLRDGHIELVETSTPVAGVTKQILIVNDVRPSDVAAYTLKAENPLGEAESQPIKLKTDRSMSKSDEPVVVKGEQRPLEESTPEGMVAPTIVSAPKEVVAGPGSSPQIETEIAGKPQPEVTWFKDGQPLSPAQLRDGHLEVVDIPTDKPDTVKQALKINELRPADVAAYHVKAENPAGQIESEPANVRLDRSMGPRDEPVVSGLDQPDQQAPARDLERRPSSGQVAPRIVSAPEEVIAGPGGHPQIEAEVSGKPEPQLTWLKDGQPISDRDLRTGHVELVDLPTDQPDTVKQALKINDFRPSDVAEYQVRAENLAGSVESEPTKVKLDRSMSSQDEPVVKGLDEGVSEIPAAISRQRTQAPVDTDSCAPSIVSVPEEVVAGRGSSPQFEAVVSGKPKPELTWFKDGQPLSEADLKSGHLQVVDIPSESRPDEVHQALKINDMKPADVAAYHVKAENPLGEAESEPINVRIDRSMSADDQPQVVGGAQPVAVEMPRLPQLARNIRAPVGSNPVLDVEVTGGQPDKVEWLKDGQVVNERPDMHIEMENLPDGTQKLHLNHLRPDDGGVYTVRATNAAGTAESGPINLIVDSSRRLSRAQAAVAPAEELFAPEVLNTTEEVVAGPGSHPQLEVHVRASPVAQVTWYKDGKPVGDKHLAPGVGHLTQSEEKSPMAPDAIKYVLKVDRMKPTDAGSYFLVAHNPLGSAESKPISLKLDKLMEADETPLVKQTVEDQPKQAGEGYGDGDSIMPTQFAPQIISMTDEVVAGVGSSPLVEVVAKSQPAPQTSWFKDGQPIQQADLDSGKFQIVRESLPDNTVKESLQIKNLKPADVAAYHVKLENPLGEVESQPTNVRLDRSMRPTDEPQVTKTETPFSPEEAAASASRAPTSAPVIKRIPRRIVAPLGSNPVIEVEVSGQPKPEVVWFKDGRQVSDVRGHIALVEMPNGVYKLCITNLKAIDQGDFTIRATNEAGEVQSAPISLVIDSTMDRHEQPHVIDSTEPEPVAEEQQLPADGFAPQIVRLSNRQNVGQVGDQARLEVEVKALPAANVTWLLDGEHIPTRLIEEGHVHIEETKTGDENVVKHILTIDSMKPSDAGQYQLEAENPFGSVKSPSLAVTLKSGDEPEVAEAAAAPGTTVADDKPKRKMRAPVIKRAPRQVVAVEGTSPVLEVEVSGEPVPKVVWFKNGKQIQRTDAHYTFDDNPAEGTYRMTVNDVQRDDEATYTVVATNEAGSAESAPIDLKVEKKPTDSRRTSRAAGFAPQVVNQTEEVVSGAGSSPTMEITIKASPKAQVTWFRDGQPLDQTTKRKFVVKEERIDSETVKYTLQINDLRPMDLGAFHVRAENDFGCMESEPINVRIDREMAPDDAPLATTIEGPDDDEVALGPGDATSARPRNIRAPQIKRMPRRVVAAQGSSPVIEVEISGEPKPEIVWFKNGKRVTQTNKVTFEEQPNGVFRLCFTDVKMTDQAEYTFQATNEAGHIESGPIELIVDKSLPKSGGPFVQEETEFPEPVVTANADGPIEAPRILNLEDQEALPGQTVKLEAEVLGNPRPDIKWLKDGDEVELNIVNEVPGSNRHSLTLKNVNDLYDGVYSIEAKNIAGTARQDAKVRIVDQVSAKPEPEVTQIRVEPVAETMKRKKSIEEPHEKPFIRRGLKFAQVNQGRSIKFEVQIDGKYDELIWMKDGEQINVPFEISEDVEMTTTTDEVQIDDDDASTIKASDDEDVDGVSGAKPKRKFPPRILMRPRNVVAGPGSRVAFEVRFEGEPRPEVVWFKNGQRLQTSGDGKVTIEEVGEDFVRLVIEDVQVDDVAEYHVVLDNPYGSERSVPVTLEIDEQMPASDDLANSSAEHPSDSYLAPGGPLKKGRAPRILRRPRAVHAPKGSRAVFEVQVAGEPEPIVNWFRDGRIINKTSDGHVMIEEYSNGCVRLVLNNITDSDVGQYHVVAENKLGSERTIPVTLTIDETTTTSTTTENETYEEMTSSMDEETRRMRGGRPPRILLRPRHLEATPGGQVSLDVSVVGQSKPSIIWYKDGKRITTTTDERITIEKVSESYERLVIRNVQESDSGKYTVSAENDFGVSMSQESQVIVSKNVTVTEETTTTTTTTTETTETFFERFVDDGTLHDGQQVGRPRRAPKFTIKPRNKKAPIGSKVDFEVKVTGEPKPDVVWYKNGRRIHTTADGRVRVEEFSDGRSKLVIEDLEETDHGVYSAEATNEWGKERTEDVQLRVVERTEVSEHYETKMRGSAKVTTKTKKTRTHYTFSEEKRTGYVTMTLTDAQMDHDGDYKLIVRNKWGEASTQAPLVVIPKVEPRGGSTRRSFSSTSDGRDSRATGGARRTPFDELEDYGHELDRSVGVFGSESRYQSGEDTYLLQLRDTEFPLRLRKYLRFGARQSPSLRSNLMDAHWGAGARVTVRERRKFREVMDEEIDDEKSGRDLRPTPMRLAKEVGTCGYAAAQLEHLRVEAAERVARKSAEGGPWESAAAATAGSIVDMMPPFFREKLKDCVVEETSSLTNQEAVFTCLAVGEPKPDYTWFRNDVIITPDANRMLISELPNGGCELRIRDPRIHDSGCFKCVARNVHGNVTCRARLRVATRPGRPEPPEYVSVTAREVFLQWRPPRDFDTNVADVLGYKLEMSQSSIGSDDNWTTLAADIGHEYYVVDDLTPGTSYSFRVSARNKFGWSDTSYSTYVTTARPADSTGEPQQRLAVPHEMRQRQYVSEVCDSHALRHCEDNKYPKFDYSIEQSPISVNGKDGNNNWQQDYDLQAEITRGRFSVISKGVRSNGRSSGSNDDADDANRDQQVVLKFVANSSGQQAQTKNEFDILRSLQHEKVVRLLAAYRDDEQFVFVMERLSGLDVLTYLSSFTYYNEDTVSKIIQQVMDAIEYLHFRGMCLLELLPDNVVMTNGRTTSLKLVDFSSARFVPRSGARVPINSSQMIEYCPPEVIANHEVSTASDVWCIGVLTYVLLSGFSPFKGDSGEEETRENVRLGRYKYDHLYGNCTPEVTRFLINVFKKHSSKRPTIEQLYENKWLLPNEFMIRKRQHAVFKTDKIAAFAEEFHRQKAASS